MSSAKMCLFCNIHTIVEMLHDQAHKNITSKTNEQALFYKF